MTTFSIGKLSFDKDTLVEFALKQIDNTGYQLQQFGITDKFNRHNCIAYLITEEKRLRGEIDRLELKIDRQKVRFNKIRRKVNDLLDQAIDIAPAPISTRLGQLKAAVI